MEIVAHALWATAATRVPVWRPGRRIDARAFVWWAMFPDLFAFVPEVAVALFYAAFGGAQAHSRGHHLLGIELYDPSHSLVVWMPVFAAAWLIFRRPVWSLLGWALHIAMDIPTHSSHFPTPFLWPVSSYRFIGVAWSEWWFMAANYAALSCVFLLLWLHRRRARAVKTAGVMN